MNDEMDWSREDTEAAVARAEAERERDAERDAESRRAYDAAIKAGEEAHLLTIGSPERTALRVARGSLDRHGTWHPHRLDAFIIWRGCRRTVSELRSRGAEAAWSTVAEHLPRRLAYYATIRVGVYATVGEHSGQVVPELSLLEALERWPG